MLTEIFESPHTIIIDEHDTDLDEDRNVSKNAVIFAHTPSPLKRKKSKFAKLFKKGTAELNEVIAEFNIDVIMSPNGIPILASPGNGQIGAKMSIDQDHSDSELVLPITNQLVSRDDVENCDAVRCTNDLEQLLDTIKQSSNYPSITICNDENPIVCFNKLIADNIDDRLIKKCTCTDKGVGSDCIGWFMKTFVLCGGEIVLTRIIQSRELSDTEIHSNAVLLYLNLIYHAPSYLLCQFDKYFDVGINVEKPYKTTPRIRFQSTRALQNLGFSKFIENHEMNPAIAFWLLTGEYTVNVFGERMTRIWTFDLLLDVAAKLNDEQFVELMNGLLLLWVNSDDNLREFASRPEFDMWLGRIITISLFSDCESQDYNRSLRTMSRSELVSSLLGAQSLLESSSYDDEQKRDELIGEPISRIESMDGVDILTNENEDAFNQFRSKLCAISYGFLVGTIMHGDQDSVRRVMDRITASVRDRSLYTAAAEDLIRLVFTTACSYVSNAELPECHESRFSTSPVWGNVLAFLEILRKFVLQNPIFNGVEYSVTDDFELMDLFLLEGALRCIESHLSTAWHELDNSTTHSGLNNDQKALLRIIYENYSLLKMLKTYFELVDSAENLYGDAGVDFRIFVLDLSEQLVKFDRSGPLLKRKRMKAIFTSPAEEDAAEAKYAKALLDFAYHLEQHRIMIEMEHTNAVSPRPSLRAKSLPECVVQREVDKLAASKQKDFRRSEEHYREIAVEFVRNDYFLKSLGTYRKKSRSRSRNRKLRL